MSTRAVAGAGAIVIFIGAILLLGGSDDLPDGWRIAVIGLVVVMLALMTVPLAQRNRQRRAVSSSPPEQPRPQLAAEPPATAATALHETADPHLAEPERAPVTFASGLASSRRTLRDRLASIRGRTPDAETWESFEEALLGADVGVATTMATLDRLRSAAAEAGITEGGELMRALGDQMRETLDADRSLATSAPGRDDATAVWLFVGVNGVGKTTTIGKVGHRFSSAGRRVVMAAGDTFRAAAASQLQTWADRCGAELISGSSGADPSSVVHDAITAAAARGADVVLADTAGRLQTRKNLMDELAKVRRVADREPGAVAETLLVIDATTGQNGLSQARAFAEATNVTGVVLTKLDGSAKGGIVFAIEAELGLPVKLVGLGEHAEDLVDFDPDSYVDALLGVAEELQPSEGE
ncbi:signal recognition particle-docking protein FtsY [Candidatus Poriferisodalis sp.]|uniref:signal recognition particle-docking protein FtsY n=1 Tax=Candidatus Poriferisodalis sp. TaxID=3101277 RepID=UPI003B02867B